MDTKAHVEKTPCIDQKKAEAILITYTKQTTTPKFCDARSIVGDNWNVKPSAHAHWSATETIQAWAQSRMKRLGRYDSLSKQLEGLTLIESVQTFLNYIDDMEKGIEL